MFVSVVSVVRCVCVPLSLSLHQMIGNLSVCPLQELNLGCNKLEALPEEVRGAYACLIRVCM